MATRSPCFPLSSSDELRGRWDAIQVGFVDDPRASVRSADELVGDVMDRLRTSFDEQRARLHQLADDDSEASTEELRLAVKRYRSFFERLLRT